MIKTPAYLQKGDTIGLVCPAGSMPLEKISECIRILNEEWGFTTKVGNSVGKLYHYFSGTDEERLADFQQMLDDDQVKAILCARGGYGVGRIIDQVDFSKFKKNPSGSSASAILRYYIHIFTGTIILPPFMHPWPMLLMKEVIKMNLYNLSEMFCRGKK